MEVPDEFITEITKKMEEGKHDDRCECTICKISKMARQKNIEAVAKEVNIRDPDYIQVIQENFALQKRISALEIAKENVRLREKIKELEKEDE